MSDLKPCPFCGGEAELLGEKVFYAWCDKCETRGDYYNTEAEAIAAWNSRAERTCEYVGDEISGGCSECRGWLDPGCAYCPSCGARVVGE